MPIEKSAFNDDSTMMFGSGYGGFGTGGTGLPGGLGGSGSKPGYPTGTGGCFLKYCLML